MYILQSNLNKCKAKVVIMDMDSVRFDQIGQIFVFSIADESGYQMM